MSFIPGQHILASFFYNENKSAMFNSSLIFEIAEKAMQSGLQVLRITEESFGPDHGYTAVIVLAESHISVHTWPEYDRIDLDLFTCNVTRDNTEATKLIFEFMKEMYKPGIVSKKFVLRGIQPFVIIYRLKKWFKSLELTDKATWKKVT